MEIREHGNWGHGLRPGTTSDINCGSCKREDASRWSCHTHEQVISTMTEARELVAYIRQQYTPEMCALFAHAVTWNKPDCPAAGYTQFLCAAAWREI